MGSQNIGRKVLMKLFTDTENNFPYFNRVLNFSGTIMVQFKAKYRKINKDILIKIT